MKRRFWIILGLCILLSTNLYATSNTEDTQVENVLIFHSYHDGLLWTDELHRGIVEGIESDNVELFVEYMDSYRTTDDNHRALLQTYYKERYKDIDISVVVVADNYAYDFMSEYYTSLFDGIPLIFGGLNNFSMDNIFYQASTGIAQTANQKETIELIMALQPEVTRIIAIGGDNATSISETEAIVEIGTNMTTDVTFDKLITDNIENQIKDLSIYGEETALILTGTMRNKIGEFYDHAQYSAAIIEATGLPAYAMASVYIESHGAVGGRVVDPYDQGILMGEYVTRLLAGEDISYLPIIDQPYSTYQFDYYRLREFDIEESMLPEGSMILNRPNDRFMINRLFVVMYFGIAFFLVLAIVILVINIKRRMRAEEELSKQNDVLKHMAFHDTTTNLYNRKYMVDYLQEHLLESHNEFTALYDLDVINLKLINDTYGHAIGNKVLKHVASILKKTFKSSKECVGIYHSEFLIVDSEVISSEHAIKKANYLYDIIAKSIEVDYMAIEIKVNIGIAVAPDHTTDSNQLLKKANIALVEAMRVAPGQIKMFEDTLYRDILKRLTLEKQLRRALAMNEFELYYQPKIDIKAMKVSGCEALIRWNHPDGTIVFPNDFIPLAEEVGIIEDIGRWVVRESAIQVKEWSDTGRDIRVSLNVSGREFDDVFIDNLNNVIDEVGVDPKLLEVEITETAALKDIDHSRLLVQMLQNIGLTVALDDFGTGYSSMTYIKQLKASKLKIDKTFIDDLENYEQKVVVDSMIQLGKKLDYTINVEGVETEEQLRILKYLGVDEIQGWYFSKAIQADPFIKFVDDFKA